MLTYGEMMATPPFSEAAQPDSEGACTSCSPQSSYLLLGFSGLGAFCNVTLRNIPRIKCPEVLCLEKPHLRSRMIPYKKILPFIGAVVRSSVRVCSSWRATVWVRLVCVTVLLQPSHVLLHLLSSSVAAVAHADHRC